MRLSPLSLLRKQIFRPVNASFRMTEQKHLPSGVFAVNKPQGITSAQVIRNLQNVFDDSEFFAELVEHQEREAKRNKRRKHKSLSSHVKMGHGGTLDPMATGVLILGIGRGTKHLQEFLSCTKSYEAVVVFGAATDTFDRLGQVIGRRPFSHVTRSVVEEALTKFRGKIMQKPSIFSALRQDGKRLYDYAREGKPLPREIEARPVEVLELEMTEWMDGGSHSYKLPEQAAEKEAKKTAQVLLDIESEEELEQPATSTNLTATTGMKRPQEHVADESSPDEQEQKKIKIDPETSKPAEPAKDQEQEHDASFSKSEPPAAKIRMTVTSGFYVRSLCHDLGISVGSLGLMSELVRTRQGDFELNKNVMEYEELQKPEGDWVESLESMLDDWNRDHGPPI